MKKAKQTDITSAVMDQIKHGDVHMRPRVYFTALTAISIAAVALSALSIAYLSSILFFWIRVETADTMAWGARANLSEAIASFPWWALGIALVLLVAATLLVRRHGHMYRHKTGTVMLALLSISLLAGLGLSLTGIDNPHSPTDTQQRGGGVRHEQLLK